MSVDATQIGKIYQLGEAMDFAGDDLDSLSVMPGGSVGRHLRYWPNIGQSERGALVATIAGQLWCSRCWAGYSSSGVSRNRTVHSSSFSPATGGHTATKSA
jgi:hypothetical protein